MPNLIRVALALLFGMSFLAFPAAAREAPQAKYTAGGTAACLRCHAADSMTVMAETAHGNAENPHTPYAQQGCEACHGPGSLHVSRARGGAGFPAMVKFGRGNPVAPQNAACLDCHGAEMGPHEGLAWAGSLHDTGRMSCSSCHQMHVAEDPMRDAALQTQNCAMCHGEQIEAHPRFERQGIVFDKLQCSDCHDVHQLRRDL